MTALLDAVCEARDHLARLQSMKTETGGVPQIGGSAPVHAPLPVAAHITDAEADLERTISIAASMVLYALAEWGEPAATQRRWSLETPLRYIGWGGSQLSPQVADLVLRLLQQGNDRANLITSLRQPEPPRPIEVGTCTRHIEEETWCAAPIFQHPTELKRRCANGHEQEMEKAA